MKKLIILFLSLWSVGFTQNVGVGTTTPSTFFHVKPPVGAVDPVRMEGLSSGLDSNFLVMDANGVIRLRAASTLPSGSGGGNNISFQVNGGNLELTDNGGTLTVPISSLNTGGSGNDLDTVIGNEYNTTFQVNGANLEITDGGGTLSVPLASLGSGGGSSWDLLGNAGTNPTTNFLGTTDNNDVVVRANNTEVFRVSTAGELLVGTTTTGGANIVTRATGAKGAIFAVHDGSAPAFQALNTGVGTDPPISGVTAAFSPAIDGRNTQLNGNGVAAATSSVLPLLSTDGSGGAFTGYHGVLGASVNVTEGVGIIGSGNGQTTYTLPTGDGAGGAFTGQKYGALSVATNTVGLSVGVYGIGNQWGVYAGGNLGASGTKSFVIDHPLDPENKVLKHYSMESPEVLNFYRGNVVLDGNGEAVVELPDYFTALNKDFSYQLTAIGSASNAYVKEEVNQKGSFIIAGGQPGQKISWNVYGQRNDKAVQANPFNSIVEYEKPAEKKGRYISPEAYGQSWEDAYFPVSKQTAVRADYKIELDKLTPESNHQ